MALILYITGVLVTIVGVLAKMVLQREYDWWAPPAARAIVRVAAVWQLRQRARYREEWLADLEFLRETEHVSGLGLALLTFVKSPLVGINRACSQLAHVATRLSPVRKRMLLFAIPLGLVTGFSTAMATGAALNGKSSGGGWVVIIAAAVTMVSGAGIIQGCISIRRERRRDIRLEGTVRASMFARGTLTVVHDQADGHDDAGTGSHA
jgi:hypothetical protein